MGNQDDGNLYDLQNDSDIYDVQEPQQKSQPQPEKRSMLASSCGAMGITIETSRNSDWDLQKECSNV